MRTNVHFSWLNRVRAGMWFVPAFLLLSCAHDDPKPAPSAVFGFSNSYGSCSVVYSYAGNTVKKQFDIYSRSWKSEPYSVNVGDSVSISAISSDKYSRVTVSVFVNGKEEFVSITPTGGKASLKGIIH